MSDFWTLILFLNMIIIPQVIIGIVASVPAWLLPVRKLCWQSTVARRVVICLLAFVSFAVSFGLCTRITVEFDYSFTSEIAGCDFETHVVWPPQDQRKYKPAIINELWGRYMTPPLLRPVCYSHEAIVCELADYVTSRPAYQPWRQYLINLGLGFIAVATSSGLVWLITRKRATQMPQQLADISSVSVDRERSFPAGGAVQDARGRSHHQENDVDEIGLNLTPDPQPPTGVYIPSDIQDCFRELDKLLPARVREKIRIDEEENLMQHHFGLGTWMRNNWGLWLEESRLTQYFTSLGVYDADSASGLILASYWRYLNNRQIELARQIVYDKIARDEIKNGPKTGNFS